MKPGPKPWNPTPWDESDLEDALSADIQVVLYRFNEWDAVMASLDRLEHAIDRQIDLWEASVKALRTRGIEHTPFEEVARTLRMLRAGEDVDDDT